MPLHGNSELDRFYLQLIADSSDRILVGHKIMITSITRFQLPRGIPTEAVKKGFLEVAPKFRHPSGLLRKYFLISEDGKTAGGVYLWQTREQAEAFYAGPWLDGIRERYGMDPQIKLFETACITDNAIEAVLLPDTAR